MQSAAFIGVASETKWPHLLDSTMDPNNDTTELEVKHPKGPFTVLTTSQAAARFHTSATSVMQRYHLYH